MQKLRFCRPPVPLDVIYSDKDSLGVEMDGLIDSRFDLWNFVILLSIS